MNKQQQNLKNLGGNNSSNTYGIDLTNSGNKNEENKGNNGGSFCC